MGKTYRHKRRLEDSTDVFDRRAKIVGKALVGSTVNPMDKGGQEYKELWKDSDPKTRNENGRTRTGLYRLFMPARIS